MRSRPSRQRWRRSQSLSTALVLPATYIRRRASDRRRVRRHGILLLADDARGSPVQSWHRPDVPLGLGHAAYGQGILPVPPNRGKPQRDASQYMLEVHVASDSGFEDPEDGTEPDPAK